MNARILVAGALGLSATFAAHCAESAGTSEVLVSINDATGNHTGAAVLWGGRVLERTVEDGQTCLTVAAARLAGKEGKPVADNNFARGPVFYACSGSGFASTDYNVGRLITVAGTFTTLQERVVRGNCYARQFVSAREVPGGCLADVPVVAVADARNWAAPPGMSGLTASPQMDPYPNGTPTR